MRRILPSLHWCTAWCLQAVMVTMVPEGMLVSLVHAVCNSDHSPWRHIVILLPAVCVGDPGACSLCGDPWCLQFNLVHLCLHSSISAHWYSAQLCCLQCLWCIRCYLCAVFVTSQMYLYLFSAQGPTVILINIFSYWLVICGDDWWVLSKLQVLYISVKLVDATDWSGHFYFCINDLYSP